MKYFSIILLLFLFLNCASSVDFQPDPDFTAENPNYSKTIPDEVEIIADRPIGNFKLVGTVIFRNFANPNDMKSELRALQIEMFKQKIDGVWIFKKTLETIPPWLIKTENAEGVTVAFTETNKEMGKLVGYPYRYRKYNDNAPKKIR